MPSHRSKSSSESSRKTKSSSESAERAAVHEETSAPEERAAVHEERHMDAKVDVRKLQILNDRINQTIDALNQVRLSVHGLGHTGGLQSPFNPYTTQGFGTQQSFGMGMPGVGPQQGLQAGFQGGF